MRIAAAALFGLGLVLGATQGHAAGTLRIGTQEDPDRLDPALGGTLGGRFVFTAMCDKLWDLKPDLGFAPQLATKWEWSGDGRALTITLREDVTYHHCHAGPDDLTRRVAAFQARINREPCALADRLWVKDRLDPEEEKLRFSN